MNDCPLPPEIEHVLEESGVALTEEEVQSIHDFKTFVEERKRQVESNETGKEAPPESQW